MTRDKMLDDEDEPQDAEQNEYDFFDDEDFKSESLQNLISAVIFMLSLASCFPPCFLWAIQIGGNSVIVCMMMAVGMSGAGICLISLAQYALNTDEFGTRETTEMLLMVIGVLACLFMATLATWPNGIGSPILSGEARGTFLAGAVIAQIILGAAGLFIGELNTITHKHQFPADFFKTTYCVAALGIFAYIAVSSLAN